MFTLDTSVEETSTVPEQHYMTELRQFLTWIFLIKQFYVSDIFFISIVPPHQNFADVNMTWE